MLVARPDIESVFDGLYEAAALPSFWPSALDALARRMNARGALVTRPDHQHQGIAYSPSPSYSG